MPPRPRSYERLRAAVADHPIPTDAGDLSLTISFGVSVWREGYSADDLLGAADDALYRAKRDGRNRVVLAEQRIPERASSPRPIP